MTQSKEFYKTLYAEVFDTILEACSDDWEGGAMALSPTEAQRVFKPYLSKMAEMLEALIQVHNTVTRLKPQLYSLPAMEKVRAVIAKAEGAA